jgi:hypothetical protein
LKRSGTAEKTLQSEALALVARRRPVENGIKSIAPVFSIDVDAAASGTTGVVAGSAVDGRKLRLLHLARGLARHANARAQPENSRCKKGSNTMAVRQNFMAISTYSRKLAFLQFISKEHPSNSFSRMKKRSLC